MRLTSLFALFLLATPALAQDDSATISEGKRLATINCTKCHNIEQQGESPLTDAPPFREIAKNYDEMELIDGFMDGLAVRHPLMPDVPTFRELGIDWVDGAYRGIGVPKSTPPEARKRLSDLWMALNNDPEMKALAAKSGFELVNVGAEDMDAFMKEKVKLYVEGAKRLGLGTK